MPENIYFLSPGSVLSQDSATGYLVADALVWVGTDELTDLSKECELLSLVGSKCSEETFQGFPAFTFLHDSTTKEGKSFQIKYIEVNKEDKRFTLGLAYNKSYPEDVPSIFSQML